MALQSFQCFRATGGAKAVRETGAAATLGDVRYLADRQADKRLGAVTEARLRGRLANSVSEGLVWNACLGPIALASIGRDVG